MEKAEIKNGKNKHLLPISFLISVALIVGAFIYSSGLNVKEDQNNSGKNGFVGNFNIREEVAPPQGAEFPVKWGNLGKQLVEAGVVDAVRLEKNYEKRGGLSEEEKALIYGENNGNLVITPQNSGLILNMLWALGLANKNEVLEKGPMKDYGDVSRFASTGGWTLAQGDAMDHYSRHGFIKLTQLQQAMIERVSKNIYRPCCDNATYFPDCNHGMAMLGFLELMASQGVSENDMYRAALILNSYWFPDNYATVAKYFNSQGVEWNSIDPIRVLSAEFSSGSGYQKILAQTKKPEEQTSGGGCGV